jgi:hypothetical protein
LPTLLQLILNMEQLIFKYLASRRELNLPGIGRFTLAQEPATADIGNQQLRAPVTTTHFQPGAAAEDYLLTRYIARNLIISEDEARKKLSEYCSGLNNELEVHGKATIYGVGELLQEPGQIVDFIPHLQPNYLLPVTAVRAIHPNEVHLIRVGEEEKTNIEMTDLLAEEPVKKTRWWIVPLILAFLAVAYLGWHFSQSGSIGSQQKIHKLQTR